MTQLSCETGKCKSGSACCRYGVSLTDMEAAIASALYGVGYSVWSNEEQGYRTGIKDGKCVFLGADGLCSIHNTNHYPEVCKKFPNWGYDGDRTICPECKENA